MIPTYVELFKQRKIQAIFGTGFPKSGLNRLDKFRQSPIEYDIAIWLRRMKDV